MKDYVDIFDMTVETEETHSAASAQSSLTSRNNERPPPKKRSKLAKILKSSTDSEQQRLTPWDKVVKKYDLGHA